MYSRVGAGVAGVVLLGTHGPGEGQRSGRGAAWNGDLNLRHGATTRTTERQRGSQRAKYSGLSLLPPSDLLQGPPMAETQGVGGKGSPGDAVWSSENRIQGENGEEYM